MCRRRILPENDVELIQRLIMRERIHIAYTFIIYETCPLWLFDLLRSSFRDPEPYLYTVDSDSDSDV